LAGGVEEVEAIGFAVDGELLHLLALLADGEIRRSLYKAYLEVYAYSGSGGLGVELVIAVSYEDCEVVRKVNALCDLGSFLRADFPAPEGPIMRIFSVGSDSSDAILPELLELFQSCWS